MQLHAVVALAFFAVLALGFVAAFLKNRTMVTEPLLAIAIGAVVGPPVLGLVDLSTLGDPHMILMETARYTLGVSVMAAAVRIPPGWLRSHAGTVAALLAVGMAAMWLTSAGLAMLVLGLALWPAVLLGAICTPTDPVLAGSILTSELAEERVPHHSRTSLSTESGANDGLALAFVVLGLHLVQGTFDWTRYITHTLLLEVCGGAALGAALGFLVARLDRWAERSHLTERDDASPVTLALALFAVGLSRALGLDGIIASFVAGVVFTSLRSQEVEEWQGSFDKRVKRLFELPVFVLFGLVLPVAAWAEGGWSLPLFALAVLLLRRPPWVTPTARGTQAARNWTEAGYLGWFGPIGISALFYALDADHKLHEPGYFEIASLVVVISALVHGFTAEPVARRFPRLEDSS